MHALKQGMVILLEPIQLSVLLYLALIEFHQAISGTILATIPRISDLLSVQIKASIGRIYRILWSHFIECINKLPTFLCLLRPIGTQCNVRSIKFSWVCFEPPTAKVDFIS